jgi:hypothetical protein
MTRILFVGQKPETVDFSDPSLPPGFDAERINAGIAVGVRTIEERGWQRVKYERFAHVELGSGESASQDVRHLFRVEDGAQRDHARICRGSRVHTYQGRAA